MNTRFPRGHNAHLVGQSYVLHGTTIAKWNRADGSVTLNSGGWQTLLTKTHINDVLRYLDSPWRVYQRDFDWYVYRVDDGKDYPFEDGITLRSNRLMPMAVELAEV